MTIVWAKGAEKISVLSCFCRVYAVFGVVTENIAKTIGNVTQHLHHL